MSWCPSGGTSWRPTASDSWTFGFSIFNTRDVQDLVMPRRRAVAEAVHGRQDHLVTLTFTNDRVDHGEAGVVPQAEQDIAGADHVRVRLGRDAVRQVQLHDSPSR
jgi:hypothetical protein